jgi:hypothetical protein
LRARSKTRPSCSRPLPARTSTKTTKSRNRHFDGYQAHVAVDPETELVTEVEIAPGSTQEAELTKDLLPELAGDDPDVTVVADSAYGAAASLKALQDADVKTVIKAPRDKNSWGGFPKSAFDIVLGALAGMLLSRTLQVWGNRHDLRTAVLARGDPAPPQGVPRAGRR